jgi:ribosomal protein L40E
MLHAGLDLSRKRLDVCLLSEHGEPVEEFSAPPDDDGLEAREQLVCLFAGPQTDEAHRETIEVLALDRRTRCSIGTESWAANGQQRHSCRVCGSLSLRPEAPICRHKRP